MKSGNFRAFTFVELLITISILALLSVVGYTAINNKQENTLNTKVTSEVETLKNALLLAKQENKVLPMPDGNNNFYAIDTSYSHDYENQDTFGVHGFITQSTLAKKYVDVIPVDPRTNSYYAYGKTKWSEMYEIASVIFENHEPKSKVIWDYTAQQGPFNLIREYNGPYFVDDNSLQNFAYNPYEKILTAKVWENSWNISINGVNVSSQELENIILVSWDTVHLPEWETATLYFSDGTVSNLWDESQETQLILQNLEFPTQTNLVTKIQLVLESWMIWNKAASLDDESEFEIYTIDSTAAVRGTIFWVQKNPSNSQIVVSQWNVAVFQNYENDLESLLEKISQNKPISREPLRWANITFDEQTQESYIQVPTGQPSTWVQISSQSASDNQATEIQIEDFEAIPTETKKDIEDNRTKFSKNIWFEIKNFKVSDSLNINQLVLKVHKKIWKSADYIEVTGKYNKKIQLQNNNLELETTSENNYIFIDISDFLEQSTQNSAYTPNNKSHISLFTQAYGSTNFSRVDIKNSDVTNTLWITNYSTTSENAESPIDENSISIRLVQNRNQTAFFTRAVTLPIIANAELSSQSSTKNLPILARKDPRLVTPPRDEDQPEDLGNDDSQNEDPNINPWEGSWDEWGDNIFWPWYIWEKSDWVDDDYELAYYAPYDVAGDINMYGKDFAAISMDHKSITWITWNTSGLPSFCEQQDSDYKANSLCKLNGETGIYIDNDNWKEDYLKYSWLNLENFMIEINLNWRVFNRYIINSNTNHTFISINRKNITIARHQTRFNKHNGVLYQWSNPLSCVSNCLPSDTHASNFYSIFITNQKISFDWGDTYYNLAEEFIALNDIFIWSNSDKNKQIDDIINYVKIYEKK